MLWAYWLGFVVYVIFVLFIGWKGYRQQKTPTEDSLDFWAAGKSLDGWSSGLSISASFMSISWSCVYDVQLFYWYGISALWLLALPWLLVLTIFFFVLPAVRKLPAFSQPEMLAQRFGQRVRKVFALPLACVFLVWAGAEIFAAAQILTPILKIDFRIVLAIIAVVVAIYSYMGGFYAVVMTDKLQYALVAFFIVGVSIVAGKAALAKTTLAGIAATMPPAPKTLQSPWDFASVGPVLVALTFIAYLPGWLVETDIWLRLQAARSDRAARSGLLIAIVNSLLFIAILPLVIGLASLLLYPPTGSTIPAELNDGAAIFALLIRDHSPAVLSVLLVVGLSAAAMSTVDTCSNVMALSLSYDILEPYLLRKHKTLNMRKVSRGMSALAVLLAYVYAVFTESLWDIFYLSSGILTTTIFLPMIALLFLPRSRTAQIQASALCGFVATLIFYFLESRGHLSAVEPAWLSQTGLGYILWGFFSSVLGFVGMSFFSTETASRGQMRAPQTTRNPK